MLVNITTTANEIRLNKNIKQSKMELKLQN